MGEVDAEGAVGGDVAPDQGVEGSEVDRAELDRGGGVVEHVLDHEGVDVDEHGLQQVQAEHREFLLVTAVGGELAAFPEEDEPVGGVPVLGDVESFVDLAAELFAGEVVAQKDRAQRFASSASTR